MSLMAFLKVLFGNKRRAREQQTKFAEEMVEMQLRAQREDKQLRRLRVQYPGLDEQALRELGLYKS